MIKNIVFDLGRVLVEFNPLQYLRRFGFDENTNNILNDIIFKSKEWVECDSGKYAITSDLVEILCNKYPEYKEKIRLVLNRDWVKMHNQKEESTKFLKYLKQEGFKIYILSNISEEAYNFVSKYDFFKFVDGGVYSYQLKICKPQLQIYNELLSKYNLYPEETIFIDDTKVNIDIAKKLKIHGVEFNNLDDVKNKIKSIIDDNRI